MPIKVRGRQSDKTAMAVMARDVVVQTCTPHLDRGEAVRACVEASVLGVNGGPPGVGGTDRVLVALTDRRLFTLAWRTGADPEPDGTVPLEFLDHAHVDDAHDGATLTIGLSTGAVVRLAVGPGQRDEARAMAAAVRRAGHATEEIPVVDAAVPPPLSSVEAASRARLAEELAALCERNRARVLELSSGLVVTATDDSASTYFVHVELPSRPQGTCPRCEHPNREGAVFCDACGTLL